MQGFQQAEMKLKRWSAITLMIITKTNIYAYYDNIKLVIE